MTITIPEGYGIARHLIQQNGKAAPYVVTMGFSQTTGASPTPELAAQEIFEAWTTDEGPLLQSIFGSVWTYQGVDVTMMGDTGPIGGSWAASWQGATTIQGVPPNCCVLVQKRTARGGRKGRGRNFWPVIWVPEADVTALGELGDVMRGDLQNRFNVALTLQNQTNFPAALLHSDGTTPNQVNSLTVSGLLATQRRRLR